MLNGEMDYHLSADAEEEAGNHRNGYGTRPFYPIRANLSFRFRAIGTVAMSRC